MTRLNLQHFLWKEQIGYLLHPSIPILGNENLKIADVGTGTGIWLLDLARHLPPTAQLSGFDIDISDCPPEKWLPQNVTMQYLDALGEIPEHLVGVYDIVQLRLFQVVVKDNDPGPLLQNVLKMLKPGGYLQWAEYDMTSQTTIKATPSLSSSTLDAIPAFVEGFKKKDGRVGMQNWIPNLPTLFRNHLLTDITSTRYPTTSPFLPYQLDVFLLTYEELASKTFDTLPFPSNGQGEGYGHGHGDRLRNLIEAASEECRKGMAWDMDRLVVVGRKPGKSSAMEEGAELEGKREENEVRTAVLPKEINDKGVKRSEEGMKVDDERKAHPSTSGAGNQEKDQPPIPGEQNKAKVNDKEKKANKSGNWLRIFKRMSPS